MTKLMLVEDDNNLREIYEARLQAEGYTIVSARDGEEALVVAKAEKPDLIISDVMMPKISGFEMLDILRNTDGLKAVKVIMLTALGQSDDQQRADRLGADRYLVKSQVTLEDIVKVAHELLEDSAGGTPSASAAPAPTAEPATPAAPPSAPSAPAPEPTAIPVAAEPAPSVEAPAPTPEPQADDNPLIDSSPAQTTAQEEAGIEARIEDFVAGATETASVGDSAEPAVIAPEPTDAAITAADDKLMADAASALSGGTDTAEPAESAEETAEAGPKPQAKKVGGERVIEPIAGEPKADLDSLLALEEAREASTKPPEPAETVVGGVDEPPKPSPAKDSGPSAAAPGSVVDPNNIAL
jgi:CheY-like chemotaxis protein